MRQLPLQELAQAKQMLVAYEQTVQQLDFLINEWNDLQLKIKHLTEEEKKKGVIASSAGNHAQGVALAAQKLGIRAGIVMPKYTPLIKVEATRQYGAEVILAGEEYDDAYNYAKELQEKEGLLQNDRDRA